MKPKIIKHHSRIPAWLSPVLRILSFIGIGITVVLVIYAWRQGYLSDTEKLQALLSNYPIMAPFLFVLIQFIQVVVPILPGGITLPAGVMMFGPWLGLLLNYAGIVLGSLAAFGIARRYGEPLVRRLIPPKTYDKYAKKLDTKAYHRFFAIAIALPIAPDDALCFLTGLSSMTFKKFALIILLCKPWTIAMYSFFVLQGWEFLLRHLG